jgi:2-keto-3-deoxy-6-phosphogluconate aldolase
MSKTIHEIMKISPVVPVMVINNADHAVPLAKALVKGGLKVLEITLRTDAALDPFVVSKRKFQMRLWVPVPSSMSKP